VLGTIAAFVVARGWATTQLERLRAWLVRNNRVLGIVLSLVIGVWFTVKGITQIV
jgi:hypothetical protein